MLTCGTGDKWARYGVDRGGNYWRVQDRGQYWNDSAERRGDPKTIATLYDEIQAYRLCEALNRDVERETQ